MTKNKQTTTSPKSIDALSASAEPIVQSEHDTHATLDDRFSDPLVSEIVEVWRLRQDYHRAEKRQVLQIKAMCRRYTDGDKAAADRLYKQIDAGEADIQISAPLSPLFASRDVMAKQRGEFEKLLKKMAKDLPIYRFVQTVKGFGELGLAALVGECGSLGAYHTVSGVWKRCGMAVIEGGRQRRVAGEDALLHGYSPERRSVFWTLADSMLKCQGKDEKAGPYRRIYDERKAYERPRVESDAHAHNRALRYMFKRLLKDLTVAWRQIESPMSITAE